MLLAEINNQIQEVTPHHYVMKQGNIYKVMKHNYNGMTLTDDIIVCKVVKMSRGSVSGRIVSQTDPKQLVVRQSDGYIPTSASAAYEVYQLQHGVMKKLAPDAADSPNYIRQIAGIDS